MTLSSCQEEGMEKRERSHAFGKAGRFRDRGQQIAQKGREALETKGEKPRESARACPGFGQYLKEQDRGRGRGGGGELCFSK